MRISIAKPYLWYSSNIEKIIFRTCISALFILIVERIFIIFTYEGHLAGIDNGFDYQIIRELAGFSMYPNPEDYPFAANPYTPIYFIICKWVASVLHITANDTISVYRVSRGVSLVADIGTVIILFSLIKKMAKCDKQRAFILTTFFWTILCYLGYTFNRSDCMFLFFYSCTLFFLITDFPKNSNAKTLLLALLTMLTIFSKQNGISLLVLIPAWFILTKELKKMAWFLIFACIFLFLAYYYFQFVYTQQTFSKNILSVLKNRIDLRWFYVYIFKLLADSPLILPIVLALVVGIKSIAKSSKSILSKIGFLFMIQFAMSLGFAVKWGSSLGYFNECYFIAFILLGLSITKHSGAETNKQAILSISKYVYPALLIFFVHVSLQLYLYFLNNHEKAKDSFNQQMVVSHYIKKQIGNNDHYVLDLTDPDWDFFKNLLYKESIAPTFDMIDCCMLPDKIFDYTEMLNSFKSGKTQFLIERKGEKQESIWNTDLSHYKVDTTIFNYTIYKFHNQ
ncbi:MAG: hypothetical protein JST58_06160 [Bacteroidetes bacterium]|nr:hypothetical protein [Bacteroidota bacterium]